MFFHHLAGGRFPFRSRYSKITLLPGNAHLVPHSGQKPAYVFLSRSIIHHDTKAGDIATVDDLFGSQDRVGTSQPATIKVFLAHLLLTAPCRRWKDATP